MHPPQSERWSRPSAPRIRIREHSLPRRGPTCSAPPRGSYPYRSPPVTPTGNYTCLPGLCFRYSRPWCGPCSAEAFPETPLRIQQNNNFDKKDTFKLENYTNLSRAGP